MKRNLYEAKWNVDLTTPGPPPQTMQKQVEAPSQDVAIRRAIQAFPGMKFTNVAAAALDPQTPPAQHPTRVQNQLPKTLAGMKGLKTLQVPGQQQQQQQQQPLTAGFDAKSFAYPYLITLPKQFSQTLNETSPVPIREANGQYHIVLINEAQMRRFFERLYRSRNRVAQIIVDGIRSSI